jgi:uncharacterized RDD family membrane protein YckC
MLKYPTVAARFWAGAIDGIIFFLVELLGWSLFGSYESKAVTIVWIVLVNLLILLYSVLLHGFYGQTVGKMFLKIKVIDVSEQRNISMKQAVFRDIFYIISVLIYLPLVSYAILYDDRTPLIINALTVLDRAQLIWAVIEIITCLTNEKRRALHDFIAGTVVVKTEYSDRLPIEKTA